MMHEGLVYVWADEEVVAWLWFKLKVQAYVIQENND